MSNLSDEISVKDLIFKIRQTRKYLLSKWVLIGFFCLIGAVMGVVYSILKKPVYSAVTTFVLEDGGGQGGGLLNQYSGLASLAGVDLNAGGGSIFQGDNLIELYKSRLMLQKALTCKVFIDNKSQLLVNKYIETNNWLKQPKLKNTSFDLKEGQHYNRLQDSVLGLIVNDINKRYLYVSKPDKKLSIIHVEVKSDDEQFANIFDSVIVKTVNDFYVQTKSAKALQNLQILQHQTDSVKSVLNGAIFRSGAVMDATPNLNPTKQILRVSGQQQQFNADANKAILTQLVQNLELAKISLRKETPLIQVIDSPVLPLALDKIGKIKAGLIGAFLLGFLSIVYLLVLKGYKSIIS